MAKTPIIGGVAPKVIFTLVLLGSGLFLYQNCSDAEFGSLNNGQIGSLGVLDSDGDGLTDKEEGELGTNPNNPDSDGDGLTDGAEVNTHGTDPNDPDTDDGGVNDGDEVTNGTNPKDNPADDVPPTPVDTDDDGLTDEKEKELGTDPNNPDTDGDKLKDGAEVNTHNTDPLDPDTDDGGMQDGDEVIAGKNPVDNPVDDKDNVDTDFDGLLDSVEVVLGTDPNNPDTDGDGLKDGAEVYVHQTDPLDPDTDDGSVNDGDEVAQGTNPRDNPRDDRAYGDNDPDKDGLTNEKEAELGTDPYNPDTDGDGLKDGAEVNTYGTDPLDPDTDDGGMRDGAEIPYGKDPVDNPADDSDDKDSDSDGLTDSQEEWIGTDPYNPDTDDDGLLDGAEVLTYRTDPLDKDTDDGGVDDGYEVDKGMNPLDPKDDKDLLDADPDKDGLTTRKEMEIGTDPMDPDSDMDGLKDGAEVNTYGTDPLDPDTDDGGIGDGVEVRGGKNPLDPSDDIYVGGENCKINKQMAVWHDPDNTRSPAKAKYLGPISAFKGELSAKDNYGYRSWSTHPVVGPTPEQGMMKAFLYKGSDGLSLVFFSNKDSVRDSGWMKVNFDVSVIRNGKKDGVLFSDDGREVKLLSTEGRGHTYAARLRYKNNSDGGVVGPLVRKRFLAHFNMMKTDDIEGLQVVGGNGEIYEIPVGDESHFMIGYRKSVDCDMANNQNKIELLRFPRRITKKTSGQFLFNLKNALEEGDSLTCSLDGNPIEPCDPMTRIPFSGMGVGPHQFQIDLVSSAGVKDTMVYNWQVIATNVVRKCLNLNKRKTMSFDVQFPDAGKTCEWSVGENLAQRNGYLQAIRRQVQSLNLPENAKLCGVSFDVPEQEFHHDDIFYLSLNNVILASNGLFSLSENEDGNMALDWDQAKGMKFPSGFNNRDDQNYCLGEATNMGKCEWPRTQKKGPITLQFDPSLIEKISSSTNNLQMIVGGDNDGADCRHSGLGFKMSVDYVE